MQHLPPSGRSQLNSKEPFSIIETMRVTARMEREAAVSRVEYRLLPKGANAVSIQFLVDAAPARKADEGLPKGVLTGELSDFPVLYKDDRSLFTAIVAGGLGALFRGNAWFGNPDAFAGQSFVPVRGRAGPKAASKSVAALPRSWGRARSMLSVR